MSDFFEIKKAKSVGICQNPKCGATIDVGDDVLLMVGGRTWFCKKCLAQIKGEFERPKFVAKKPNIKLSENPE